MKAFDKGGLGGPEKAEILRLLLEALVGVNELWLRRFPQTPRIYQSGVIYLREPSGRDDWQDIPECLYRRNADCEDLASWRVAELRAYEGIEAHPYVKGFELQPGKTLYHIQVILPNGEIEDPSRKLGMR